MVTTPTVYNSPRGWAMDEDLCSERTPTPLSPTEQEEREIMTTPGEGGVTPEEFRLMTERAGLGLRPDELEELKPLYDMYAQYIKTLHSIDFQAEEIGMTFHPDWPSA